MRSLIILAAIIGCAADTPEPPTWETTLRACGRAPTQAVTETAGKITMSSADYQALAAWAECVSSVP